MERPPRPRAVLVLLATSVLLTVAGCTGGSDGDGDPSTPVGSSSAVSSAPSTPLPTTGGTDVPSATNPPATPSATGSVTGPALPDVPTVPAGDAGAYTLVVSGGGAVTTPVPQVLCQQDGSLSAGGLQLAAGGTSLRFTDVAPVGTLEVPGSADLTAEGGTFRGATDTTAVTFTWTC